MHTFILDNLNSGFEMTINITTKYPRKITGLIVIMSHPSFLVFFLYDYVSLHKIPYDCVDRDRLKQWGLFSRSNTLKYTQAVP